LRTQRHVDDFELAVAIGKSLLPGGLHLDEDSG
jgi:hypothetical protein